MNPCACKVCQEIDGKVYESANDIPDRPHPNCKCHIELIEKEREITDPIEIYQEQRREKQRVILEIQKAKGDILSMTEEIDEFLKQVDEEENKLMQLKNITDINNLEKTVIEKLNKAFEQVEFARFRGEKVKKELSNLHSQSVVLEGRIEKTNVLDVLFNTLAKSVKVLTIAVAALINPVLTLTTYVIKQLVKDNFALAREIILYVGANTYGKYVLKQKEAVDLLTFSFTKGKINTVEGAKLYEKVSDLNNNKLETVVRAKLNSQLGIKEARGFVFNDESDMAKKIAESEDLKNFFNEKNRKQILENKRILEDGSFEFKSGNLHNALGHVDIIDIQLDKENNLIAKIIDTYDFNKTSDDWKVQWARIVQDANLLENYFEVVLLKIPYEVWSKF